MFVQHLESLICTLRALSPTVKFFMFYLVMLPIIYGVKPLRTNMQELAGVICDITDVELAFIQEFLLLSSYQLRVRPISLLL